MIIYYINYNKYLHIYEKLKDLIINSCQNFVMYLKIKAVIPQIREFSSEQTNFLLFC